MASKRKLVTIAQVICDDLNHVFPFSGETKSQTVADGGLTGGEDTETISRWLALKTRETIK